jgi:4'-phosphopantetheinyl transferase
VSYPPFLNDVSALSRDEVHVWQIDLDVDASPYWDLLATEERERALRFRFERDRDHYTVGRGSMRVLLGRYLGGPPSELRFGYGAHGKPELEEPSGSELRFNLSHSHRLALLAVTAERAVGVDIEGVHRDVGDEQIARRFFSSAEVSVLLGLPEAERRAAFFRCWTRKEAYLKARGDGIYYGLHHFAVTLAPGEPAALLSNALHPAEVARWSMSAVPVPPGYEAAVAVEGSGWTLRSWKWGNEEMRSD